MVNRSALVSLVKSVIAPQVNKVVLMIARGIISNVNEDEKCQLVQVSLRSDEVRDDVERFQEYGFTSSPPNDSEVLTVSIGGNRAHTIAICAQDRTSRPTGMDEGDVALFTTAGILAYLDRSKDELQLGAQSGGAAVSRIGDKTVADTTMNTWITAVSGFINGLAPGTVTPPTDFGVCDEGATKVKAT